MRRSVIDRLSPKWRWLLTWGFGVYLFLCWPVIARRGYPEIDPFYLAIPWLWAVPVMFSAPFVGFSWGRVRNLLIYSFGAAAVMGGCFNEWAIPRHVDLAWMFVLGPIDWGLIVIAGTVAAEAIAQLVLRYVRVFAGTLGTPTTPPGVVEAPWRIRGYCIVLLAATLAFPFVYRQIALARAEQRGVKSAEQAWTEGAAVCAIPFDEMDSERGIRNWSYDPRTGLEIYAIGDGIAERTFWEAYRRVIEQKVARYGPAPLAKCLFTPEELVSLLNKAKFERLSTFPFKHGSLTINADGSMSGPDWTGRTLGKEVLFMYRTVVPEKGNSTVLVTDDGFKVIHPDGRILQSIWHPITEEMIRVGD